uniref:Ycf2 N-terminal domain-containing protein n=1 Tax=Salix viminalis TaxID=40686 RepID=A0A6N2KHR6_SALVM
MNQKINRNVSDHRINEIRSTNYRIAGQKNVRSSYFLSRTRDPYDLMLCKIQNLLSFWQRLLYYYNQYRLIVEVIDKDLSKSFLSFCQVILFLYFFFLSNSLPFFFVSFGNIPIHRSEIHIYELKGPNDQLCNQLLEPIGLQIVH